MLHNLFEKTAIIQKNKVALKCQNKTMSYERLNTKSNQLAHELIKEGVTLGTNIAVLMDRSIEMIISILAILKAGGIYVPIDSEYPEAAIDYIIRNSLPKLILANSKDKLKQISYYDIRTIFVDQNKGQNTKNPNINLPDDALAYIIYTSGSTGNPKGVMIEHRNVMSLLNAVEINFSASDVWTLFHSVSFDFSVWELFGALLTGAGLVIVPNDIRKNLREFRRLLIKNEITILNITPSVFYSLQIEELKNADKQLSLKNIIFGGDKLIPKYLKEWKERYPETKLINMYGITETTIHVTYKEILIEDIDANISDIGQALSHLKIYLLDENFTPVLTGEIGEIFVEGAGLARGYLNNPSLTKERFLECPGISENKLYRSGDLGRYLSDGSLEYIGRADNQVKIRGHRIELEAVESHLNKFEGIKQSIVTALERSDINKILIAFYTSEKNIASKDIVDFLASRISAYMIPVEFKRVEKFILTINGKIDRKRIYECIEVKPDVALATPPAYDELTEIQKNIFNLIAENLNEEIFDNLSLDTDFNSLLDSITFIKIVVALEEEFAFEFDDEMLLITNFPTMRTMVEYVELKIITNG